MANLFTKHNQEELHSTPYLIQVRKVGSYDWITYQGLWPSTLPEFTEIDREGFAIDQADAIMRHVIEFNPDFDKLYTGIRVIKILAFAEVGEGD